jgi:hypothetical protein
LAARTGGGQHPDDFLDDLLTRAGIDPMDLRRNALPDRQILELDPVDGR